MRTIRLGAGAGYSGDRIEPAVELVRERLAGIVRDEVTRYELPLLGALNFVLRSALGGGVSRSLALDAHGKGLSSAVLDLDIPDDPSPDATGCGAGAAT